MPHKFILLSIWWCASMYKKLRSQYLGLQDHFPVLRRFWARLLLVVVAVLIVVSPIYAVITDYMSNQTYKISSKESALLSQLTVDAKYIKETTEAITYNRADEEPTTKGVQQAITLAANKTDATGEQPYQAELSKDPKKGITFSDSDGNRNITLLPKFSTLGAKLTENRVMYPSGTNEKHIYSFKTNGIKNDIVLTKAPGEDTKTYAWQLKLDKNLEARMSSDGSVGVYSADEALFDNVQVGDQKSQQLIDKARSNGAKNSLVFELPKPFILDANNQTKYEDVSYSLQGDLLTLTANNLNRQSYPLTIDPTITVTTTSEFLQQTGNTGNIDTSTAGQISRAFSDAGAVGGTISTGTFTTTRRSHTSVVYNGYLYIIGGTDGTTAQNDIQYCPLNAGGSVGACTRQTSAFTTARAGHTSVVYNGYLYIIGGTDGTTAQNDIQYCPLNAGGSVGACTQQAGAFTTARWGHTSVVYNGYLYIIGGWNGTTYYNDIQYCPLNAGGSVGACTQQAGAFTTARYAHTSVVYNGYLYIIGGNSGSSQNDIQYCPLNAGGSVGACTRQTSAFTTARSAHTSVVYNGYLYITDGTNGSAINDVQYCPLNTNGSVGACTQQAGAFTTARWGQTSVVYDGYIYISGGWNGTTYYNDIQSRAISSTLPQAVQQSGAFTTARYRHGIAAYDGYMYVAAGSTGSSELDTVIKCVINNDASLGTCSSAGTLVRPTSGASVTMYHNVIYMSGGYILEDDNVVPDVTHCVIGLDHNVDCTRQIKTINKGNTDPWLLGSAAYNGYLYLVGGHTDSASGYLNIVYRCAISDSDGSIGNCASAGSTLTVARDKLSVVIYKGYLYAIGGSNGSGYRNDIESCPINTNGTVGTCSVKTTFTNARGEHTSAVYGDKLYIMGGWNGTTYYNDIIYCTLGSSGAASGCAQQTNAFTTARYGHDSTMYNGYLYILGGKSSGSYLNDAQYMQLGPSHGGVGSGSTGTFATTRDSHASVAYDGYLYIIGGWNDPTVYGDIKYCSLGANGTIGTCNTAAVSLNIPRYNHTAVVNNGYIYVTDGLDSGGTNLNNVEYCAINSGTHNVTSCTSQNNLFATARNNHASVSYNGRLYVVGGIINGVYQSDVEYCSYNANGSLSNCDQQLSVFPAARNNLSAEVYNGYLYIVGGYDGTYYRNDIIHCPISSANGSIGTCIRQNDALPMNRRSMTTAVYNGYLYVFGGYKNTDTVDYNDDMQACRLLPNGDVGNCTVTTGVLWTPLSSQDTVYYNGYAYVSGGSTGSGAHYNTVQSIALNKSMPMVARYERVIDTGAGGNTINSFTINGTAACNYTVAYKTAGSDGIFGSVSTRSNVVAGVAQSLNLTNKQYILIVATLDDASCGTQTTITSIVVDYIFPLPPNAPTLRLPTNAATSVSVRPDFQLGVTGDTSGNLDYLIDVCSTSNCSSIVRTIDQTASSTGWTNVGVVVDTYVVNHDYQLAALSPGTQYWWRAKAIDTLNANLWSSYSSIYSFTTAAVTSAPTFTMPTNGGTGVNVRPEFRLGVTGNISGNLKYKIDVCSTSNCSSIVRTVDETSSETGWTSLGNISGTVTMSHTYLPAALSSATQYWFRGQAIDPTGANAWSAYSSIFSFTTGVVNAPGQININQNSKIYSGTTLKTGN
jgi:hypothetical protein